MPARSIPDSASFRDPSGRVVRYGDRVFREISDAGIPFLNILTESGLYDQLVAKRLLLAHEVRELAPWCAPGTVALIEPEQLQLVTYPYEWCFSQLKDAALLTLAVQREALDRGLVLRDASAFNVQFQRGRAIFIDTLSFDRYHEGEPWGAYGQFCRHFLAPLASMALVHEDLSKLWRGCIDGIPLALVSKLLPLRTWVQPALLIHLHMHAWLIAKEGGSQVAPRANKKLSKAALITLIKSLEDLVLSLEWKRGASTWGDYYDATNYSNSAMDAKHRLVREALVRLKPKQVWDLGANTGAFSQDAAECGAFTVSADFDVLCVERHYRELKRQAETRILPLVVDLVNPTPAIGWGAEERVTLAARSNADCILALALVHHLAIANNIPLERCAEYFARLAPVAIVEFVPKSDSQVKRLLATREDIFPQYTEEGFRRAFEKYYSVDQATRIEGSERTLFVLTRVSNAG